VIEQNLQLLRGVLNWATSAADPTGRPLLERHPLRGRSFVLPREKNPRREPLSEEDYRALLLVANRVDWRFRVALVLAHETGHRIGAIRQLRWSDVDLTGERVLWRAEVEKTGFEHSTPLTGAAVSALRAASAMLESVLVRQFPPRRPPPSRSPGIW